MHEQGSERWGVVMFPPPPTAYKSENSLLAQLGTRSLSLSSVPVPALHFPLKKWQLTVNYLKFRSSQDVSKI